MSSQAIKSSESERYFALQWWKRIDSILQEDLGKKYFPQYSFVAVTRSTSCIVKIYREENK